MYSHGLVIGKFAPLTYGHINLINSIYGAYKWYVVQNNK